MASLCMRRRSSRTDASFARFSRLINSASSSRSDIFSPHITTWGRMKQVLREDWTFVTGGSFRMLPSYPAICLALRVGTVRRIVKELMCRQ